MIIKINGAYIQFEDYVKIVKARIKNPLILEVEVAEILQAHFTLMSEDERREREANLRNAGLYLFGAR